jgi:Tol biopolymer transport system component
MRSSPPHAAKSTRVILRAAFKFSAISLFGLLCGRFSGAQGSARPSAKPVYWIAFDDVSLSDFKSFPLHDIYLMDENGKHTKRLSKDHRSHNPSWSPDGQQILFLNDKRLPKIPNTGDPTYDALLSYWDNLNIARDVVRMDADGNHVSRIAETGPDTQGAAWLPGERSVAIRISNQRDILAVGPRGAFRSSEFTKYIKDMMVEPFSKFVGDYRPFPRDLIRYERGPYGSRFGGTLYFLLSPPTDNFRPAVFLFPSNIGDFNSRAPALDYRDRSGSVEIVFVDGKPSSLAAHAFDTAWSPDGKHMAYSAFSVDQNSVLYSAELKGDNTSAEGRGLTDQELDAHAPAWSADGKSIAFIGLWKDSSQIFIVNVDGSNLVQLTNNPAMSCYHAAWSPDGKQIAADCQPTGGGGLHYDSPGWWMGWFSNIYIFQVDKPGGKPRQLTKCRKRSVSYASACSAHNPSFAPAGTVLP